MTLTPDALTKPLEIISERPFVLGPMLDGAFAGHCSLAAALARRQSAGVPIAMRGGRPFQATDLLGVAESASGALACRREQRWALWAESSSNFLAGLVALLHQGKTVLLPANAQPGAWDELSQEADAAITDCDHPPLEGKPHLKLEVARASSAALPPSPAAMLELFTSGSSGAQKKVSKQLRQLESEVAVLEHLWGGESLREAVFLAAVSHQHIYGLLYKILWPFITGRTFLDAQVFFPETLEQAIGEHSSVVLISSPAQLSRLPDTFDFELLRRRAKLVFSSGGPLAADAAANLEKLLGRAPLEVLGSTETGGIAWRSRSTGSDGSWEPLPCVQVGLHPTERTLIVSSPFASADGEPYVTSDRAELTAEGRIILGGRSDRIVKIEERRVSLDAVERRLNEHELVREAACADIELDVGFVRRRRRCIGAAVVVSPAGRQALAFGKRSAVAGLLRQHLSAYFESSALPRVIRFVDELPCDTQGKRSHQALCALLQRGRSGHSRLPELLSVQHEEDAADIELRVPESLAYLDGHFPGAPVVPGFALLEWALAYARQYLETTGVVNAFESIKFHTPLVPGSEARLELYRRNGQSCLEYRYTVDGAAAASGKVRFTPLPGG